MGVNSDFFVALGRHFYAPTTTWIQCVQSGKIAIFLVCLSNEYSNRQPEIGKVDRFPSQCDAITFEPRKSWRTQEVMPSGWISMVILSRNDVPSIENARLRFCSTFGIFLLQCKHFSRVFAKFPIIISYVSWMKPRVNFDIVELSTLHGIQSAQDRRQSCRPWHIHSNLLTFDCFPKLWDRFEWEFFLASD